MHFWPTKYRYSTESILGQVFEKKKSRFDHLNIFYFSFWRVTYLFFISRFDECHILFFILMYEIFFVSRFDQWIFFYLFWQMTFFLFQKVNK